jgi:hypothetical protein
MKNQRREKHRRKRGKKEGKVTTGYQKEKEGENKERRKAGNKKVASSQQSKYERRGLSGRF